MIPREWAALLQPVPGKLFVRRVEQPTMRGRLYLPDGAENYRRMTRSQEAFVTAVGEGVAYEPGQRVLLAETVGREVHFGFRGEVRFLEISPYQILAVLREAPEQPLTLQADPLRGVEGELVEAGLQEARFDEGSAEGLL